MPVSKGYLIFLLERWTFVLGLRLPSCGKRRPQSDRLISVLGVHGATLLCYRMDDEVDTVLALVEARVLCIEECFPERYRGAIRKLVYLPNHG